MARSTAPIETVRSADGTTIAFERQGDGPAVVLVVGALNDRRSLGDLAGALSGTFTVVRYDRRGRGDSGDAAPYAPAREIEDLAAVLEATEARLVYGHSSGAILALFAAMSAVAIERLGLYEPPFIISGTRPALDAGFAAMLQGLIDAGEPHKALRAFLGNGMLLPDAAVDTMLDDDGRRARLEALATSLPYELALCGDAALPGRDRLEQLGVETLVACGERSPSWARASTQELASRLGGAAAIIEGEGHAVSGDVLAPMLAAFFAAPSRFKGAGRAG